VPLQVGEDPVASLRAERAQVPSETGFVIHAVHDRAYSLTSGLAGFVPNRARVRSDTMHRVGTRLAASGKLFFSHSRRNSSWWSRNSLAIGSSSLRG
jgi:hypothetical protein